MNDELLPSSIQKVQLPMWPETRLDCWYKKTKKKNTTLSCFSARRRPAVTAPSWCGILRSRYVSVAASQIIHKNNSIYLYIYFLLCRQSVRRWSALCPFRLRWSVGLCCRRPMTSLMQNLCVDWPGSPRRRRSVTQLFVHLIGWACCV